VVGLPLVNISGRYESTHLIDLRTYSFSLCEICLRKMFESFKLPPRITAYAKGEITYEQDQEDHLHHLWLQDGGDQKKLSTGLCNRTQECSKRAEFRDLRKDGVGRRNYCNFHAEEWGSAGHVGARTEENGAMLELSSLEDW